jgi:hypothetical protein
MSSEQPDSARYGKPVGLYDVGPIDIDSMREWLAHWGDGPNWCSPDGTSVPIVKGTLRSMLDEMEAMRKVVENLQLDVMDLPDEPEPADSLEDSGNE